MWVFIWSMTAGYWLVFQTNPRSRLDGIILHNDDRDPGSWFDGFLLLPFFCETFFWSCHWHVLKQSGVFYWSYIITLWMKLVYLLPLGYLVALACLVFSHFGPLFFFCFGYFPASRITDSKLEQNMVTETVKFETCSQMKKGYPPWN